MKKVADELKAWAKSAGKKPKKWAKIPVQAIEKMALELNGAEDELWKEAGEKMRTGLEWQAAMRELLKRALPALTVAKKVYEAAGKKPGATVAALNSLEELGSLIGEVEKALEATK